MKLRAVLLVLVGVSALAGCSTQYQDASYSYRTVGDSSETKNDYVGLNFRFAVDQSPEYHAADNTEPFASAQ